MLGIYRSSQLPTWERKAKKSFDKHDCAQWNVAAAQRAKGKVGDVVWYRTTKSKQHARIKAVKGSRNAVITLLNRPAELEVPWEEIEPCPDWREKLLNGIRIGRALSKLNPE